MATEYVLRRSDRKPLGSFHEVQAVLTRLFPGVQFGWTESGHEKVLRAHANGVELPDGIRRWMEGIPSLLEGIWEGQESTIFFGLGYLEPVEGICVQPHGRTEELEPLLTALEREIGGKLIVATDEPLPAGLASPTGAPPPPSDWQSNRDG